MTPFKTVVLSVSALLISIASVQAAPHHHMKMARHHMVAHKMSHHRMAGHMTPRGSVANADHSADALNAQSLTRSQGATQ